MTELPGMWEESDLSGGWADTEADRVRGKAPSTEETCEHCGGSGADPDDPGDWDSAVHMYNPTTIGPCPECDGEGTR